MDVKKNIFICIVLSALFSCGVTKRVPQITQETEEISIASLSETLSGEATASYLYMEGIRSMVMEEDTSRSISLLKKVLETDSLHAPTYYELGGLYAHQPQKAVDYLKKANSIDTANVWYKTALARAYIGVKQYDSALAVYNALMKESPDEPMNYQMLAALYREQKQLYMAISVLDSAEVRFGFNEEFSAFKRQVLIEAKLYDRAISEAETMVTNFPYDEENYTVLAELYARTGKDSLALASFDKALAINPDNITTIISLNEYYKQARDNVNFIATAKKIMQSDDIPVEAKLEFFKEITANENFYAANYFQINDVVLTLAIKYPKNPYVIRLYARHLMMNGDTEGALNLYKANIHDTTLNREMLSSVLDIEAYRNRPDSVAKYSDIALHYFPTDAEFALRKGSGVLSYYLKDYKGAEAELKRALKYARTDSLRSVIYTSLGDNSHLMGKEKESFQYYEKAISYDPANIMALNNYSYFLSLSGKNLERALEMSAKVIRLDSSNPTYLDTYAWVLYKLGRYDEAKSYMRQAIALDKYNNKELFIHYGDILYALGDNFLAGVYWKKAAEFGYDKEEVAKRLMQIEE